MLHALAGAAYLSAVAEKLPPMATRRRSPNRLGRIMIIWFCGGCRAAPTRQKMEHDSKQIVRRWNREIEEAIRRREAADRAARPWRPVVWGALWLVWLALLVALIAYTRGLG
jgi:hypothetical protein